MSGFLERDQGTRLRNGDMSICRPHPRPRYRSGKFFSSSPPTSPHAASARIETNAMDVREKVKSIIVEQLGVDEAQVDDTASFIDDLGADSLDIVELVMAFEEAFGIDVPDEEAEKLTTVKAAIDYIEAKKKK